MAHSVKCKYCQKTFDRDKIAFVQVSSKRYAHADCYLREKVKDANIPELEIIDPNKAPDDVKDTMSHIWDLLYKYVYHDRQVFGREQIITDYCRSIFNSICLKLIIKPSSV